MDACHVSISKVNINVIKIQVHGGNELVMYVQNIFERYMAFHTENYKYDSRYKNGLWDGKIRFVSMVGGSMVAPAGLLPLIVSVIKKHNMTLHIEDNCKAMFLDRDSEASTNEWLDNVKDVAYTPEEHQRKMVVSALKYKRVVLESPTGSGKSMGIYLTVRRYMELYPDKSILLMVPSVSLVDQMYGDFIEYGWDNIDKDVGKVYGDAKIDKEEEFFKKVVISTTGSVAYSSGIIEPKDSKGRKMPVVVIEGLLKRFEMVIVDEVHGASSTTLQKILSHCTNAGYRVGFTGTVPLDEVSSHVIFGAIGPRIIVTTTKELIDKGILCDVTIVGMILNYDKEAIKKSQKMSYENEVKSIESNGSRQKVFDRLYELGYISEDTNTMMLFNYRKAIEDMKNYINEKYPQFKVLTFHGDTTPQDKALARSKMEENPGYILLATFGAAAAGVSIKRLHNLVLASSFKSYTRVIQSIGRALRKHATKTMAMVFDVVDNMTKINKVTTKENNIVKHWRKRLGFYSMQEFRVKKMVHPDVFSIPDDIMLESEGFEDLGQWGM